MEMLKNVLLVDDDSVSNYITTLLLKKLKISRDIQVAKNGFEALSKIAECNTEKVCPDLIILDHFMPVMDGIEFLEAFKKMHFVNKENCVFLVLSSSIERDEKKFRELGVNHFSEKPLKIQSVLKIINEYSEKVESKA